MAAEQEPFCAILIFRRFGNYSSTFFCGILIYKLIQISIAKYLDNSENIRKY